MWCVCGGGGEEVCSGYDKVRLLSLSLTLSLTHSILLFPSLFLFLLLFPSPSVSVSLSSTLVQLLKLSICTISDKSVSSFHSYFIKLFSIFFEGKNQ